MTAEPPPPVLKPERSVESLPDLDDDGNAVAMSRGSAGETGPGAEPRNPSTHTSHASFGVIDEVVTSAVDASMEMGEDEFGDEQGDFGAGVSPGGDNRRAAAAEPSVSPTTQTSAVTDPQVSPEHEPRFSTARMEQQPPTSASPLEQVSPTAEVLHERENTLPVNPMDAYHVLERCGGEYANLEDVVSVTLTGFGFDSVAPEALEPFAECLERLALDENEFRAVDFQQMATTLKKLQHLNIALNRIDDTFKFINSSNPFQSLTVLDARSNGIGLRGFTELGKLPQLKRLDVSRNQISKLAGVDGDSFFFPSLTFLDLSSQTPGLDCVGFELTRALGKCPALRVLKLRDNQVRGWVDRVDDANDGNSERNLLLPGNDFPSLRALDLRDNLIGDILEVEPLAHLAVSVPRRTRRGMSSVGVNSHGPDDNDGDQTPLLFDAGTSSFRDGYSGSMTQGSVPQATSSNATTHGQLEEVALSGNVGASRALLEMEQDVLMGYDDGSLGNTQKRLTPKERLGKVLEHDLLFQSVTPSTRFGATHAVAMPLKRVLLVKDTAYYSQTNKSHAVTSADALLILRDDVGPKTFDGELSRRTTSGTLNTTLNMQKMATALDILPPHISDTAKVKFDFDARSVDLLDDWRTVSASDKFAAKLDAWNTIDKRKAFNLRYTAARSATRKMANTSTVGKGKDMDHVPLIGRVLEP